MRARNYQPPAFTLEGGKKDLTLIRNMARESNLDTSLLDATAALTEKDVDETQDFSCIYETFFMPPKQQEKQ
jgi:3-hydroxyisobutyrate dehydrogenase-like beta-hydroxyacid dehydrogenase